MTEIRPGYISDGNNNWIQIGPSIPLGSTVYYQATEPATPQTGDIWIDSDNEVPSIDNSQFLRWRKTVSGGETSLSGLDDSGLSLQYTPAYEQVYLNGVLLVRGADYTATTGTSITGLTALAASDVVEVFSVVARTVGDVYTQSQTNSLLDTKSNVSSTGLVLLTSQSFNSVSSVSFNNVFNSSYENYKLIYTGLASVDQAVRYRMRLGTTDATGANYNQQWLTANNTTIVGTRTTSQTSGFIGATGSGGVTSWTSDIFNPFIAGVTTVTTMAGTPDGSAYLWFSTSRHTASTSYDGISIIADSGTLTGTIKIYGYK